jgi:hypothetical protein
VQEFVKDEQHPAFLLALKMHELQGVTNVDNEKSSTLKQISQIKEFRQFAI